jgi:hypothetical protein
MRLREDKVRRIAERVVDEMRERGLVSYTASDPAARSARVKVVYDIIVADLKA